MNFIQLELFNLIGGSWPPAPREPERLEYGSVPRGARRTMQHSGHNERIKSVNLINHLAPEKRKIRQNTSNRSGISEESVQSNKMVNETKKVETGVLIGESNITLLE